MHATLGDGRFVLLRSKSAPDGQMLTFILVVELLAYYLSKAKVMISDPNLNCGNIQSRIISDPSDSLQMYLLSLRTIERSWTALGEFFACNLWSANLYTTCVSSACILLLLCLLLLAHAINHLYTICPYHQPPVIITMQQPYHNTLVL